MKGVICAGGKGTRLNPITLAINKHMVPILEKPMILYPISTLKALGIKDIMIVSGGNHVGGFADFLGDGSKYGVNLTYRVQEGAGGIAQAVGLAEDFAAGGPIVVILGDNVYDNDSLPIEMLEEVGEEGAQFYFARVPDPERFGVPYFNEEDLSQLIGIEEKPKEPKSKFAVTGLYVYPNNVFEIIKILKPSERGELEITDVNNWYVERKKCAYHMLQGFWKDCGKRDSLKETIDWAYKNGR